jgi:hypothetical protein
MLYKSCLQKLIGLDISLSILERQSAIDFLKNNTFFRSTKRSYYIINGTGKIKMGNDDVRLIDDDIFYIPENTSHSIINDGEVIDFWHLMALQGKNLYY